MKTSARLHFAAALAAAVLGTVATKGDTTINVPSGTTNDWTQALTGGTVHKTGGGGVRFTVAASSFEGPLLVEEGTAILAISGAFGTADIEVSSGAALVVAHASPGQTTTAVQGTVTIAGNGPDGMGALQFTGSGSGHKLFNSIVLSGNATMSSVNAVGARNLDMGGHDLTWKKGPLVFRGCNVSNAGNITYESTSPDFTFQDGGTFDASCAAKTISVNSSIAISLVSYAAEIPFGLEVNNAVRLSAASGAGINRNVWAGPISVTSGKKLTLRAVGASTTLRVAGAISGAGAVAWEKPSWDNAGTIWLDGSGSSWSGGFTSSSGYIYALSKGAIGGFGTSGVPTISNTGNNRCVAFANVGAPVAGAATETVWSAEDVRDFMAGASVSGMYAAIGLNAPAGSTFTFSYDVPTGLNVSGGGTVTLVGGFPNQREFRLCGGSAILDAADANTRLWRHMILGDSGANGVLELRNGRFSVVDGPFSIGSAGRFALWQTGGRIDKTSWVNGSIATGAGSYGAWLIEDGTANIFYPLNVAEGVNSYGAIVQKGGSFAKTRSNNGSIDSAFALGVKGDAMMYVSGGTNNSYYATSPGTTASFNMGTGVGGTATLTVSGTNTLLKTDILVLGVNDSARTNVFNISDGGTFEANRFYAGCYNADGEYYPYSNGCFNVVNIDGGIMRPTLEDAWNHAGSSCPARDPEKFILFGRGLTVDTEACSYAHQFPFHIDPATGSGFDAIYLPTNDAAFMAQTYIGPAHVRISDASGWGATAFADFDKTTGKLVGVIVTSRGCDYSASPSVTVDSADGSRTYSCTFVLSQNVCGGLTKRGTAAMHLYGTNTYSGVTCVESGTLRAMHAKAIPANSHCRVKNGATLQLPGAMSISSVGGSGTIIGGAVTLTGGIIAHSEDLNVRRGLVVEGGVTFTDGAKVRIADFAALDAAQTGMPLITASSAIVGTPEIDRDSIPEPYGIRFTGDRRTLKLCNLRGLRIIFR